MTSESDYDDEVADTADISATHMTVNITILLYEWVQLRICNWLWANGVIAIGFELCCNCNLYVESDLLI